MSMNKNLPPLNWIRTFEAAARLLNFSAAGRELNMTQSAVSQQIKLLEHHLGGPLFSRKNRAVVLTNSGQAFLPVVQESISRLQKSVGEIFSPIGKGQLVLEVSIAFATLWLAPRLKRFCDRYPELSVQIIYANWESDFNNTMSDLCIIHGQGNKLGYVHHPLFEASLTPYCAPHVAQSLTKPEDLLALPLIDITGNRQGWNDWLQAAGIVGGETAMRHKTDSLSMAVQMAESGLGVVLAYNDFFTQAKRPNQLVAPFDLSIETQETYFMTYAENRPLSKSAAAFLDWVMEEISDENGDQE